MFLTKQYQSYTIFSEKSKVGRGAVAYKAIKPL